MVISVVVVAPSGEASRSPAGRSAVAQRRRRPCARRAERAAERMRRCGGRGPDRATSPRASSADGRRRPG